MLAQADGELLSGDELYNDMQDAGLPEPMSRRRSSFTALVGQASGLRDLLRRYEATSAPFRGHPTAAPSCASRPWVGGNYLLEFQECAGLLWLPRSDAVRRLTTWLLCAQDFLQQGAWGVQALDRVQADGRQRGPGGAGHTHFGGSSRHGAAAGRAHAQAHQEHRPRAQERDAPVCRHSRTTPECESPAPSKHFSHWSPAAPVEGLKKLL